ncbi:hypothetical protein FKM82_018614 [Ascaphus truei]
MNYLSFACQIRTIVCLVFIRVTLNMVEALSAKKSPFSTNQGNNQQNIRPPNCAERDSHSLKFLRTFYISIVLQIFSLYLMRIFFSCTVEDNSQKFETRLSMFVRCRKEFSHFLYVNAKCMNTFLSAVNIHRKV